MTAVVVALAVVSCALGLGLAVAIALAYNGFINRRNRVVNAWSQVDVQLKRRHDLVPNLVATVKGYAAHERNTLEAVTAARGAAVNAHGPAQQAAAELALTGAVRGLLGIAEAYPSLRASGNFLDLQEELSESEGRIAYARQFYNNAVLGYNNATQSFPGNIVARLFRFEAADYFGAAGGERDAVAVKFD